MSKKRGWHAKQLMECQSLSVAQLRVARNSTVYGLALTAETNFAGFFVTSIPVGIPQLEF